ncbi:outer membrane protein assembly factor BamD [Terriglobus sp. RCC_193]|uniref:outer membrane protein assembly factor BamD n=1 Tax=Terriglobus sp. RCC_193 TaxID=3239218 RepID=UPI0035269ED8
MVSLFGKTALPRSFFIRRGVAVALLMGGIAASACAQQSLPPGTTSATPDDQTPTAVLSNNSGKKTRKSTEEKKDDKVVKSKDTVKSEKARKQQMKVNPLGDVKSSQPDKLLYDKAMVAINKGRFEVARLDLQTLLSTYPDSEYQMRSKLAFADSWYREGGSAALAQAETEYHDFIIFFPNAPEAAEAQMRIGDIYFKQMDRPDRDYTKGIHAQEEYRTMLAQYPDSSLIPEAKQHLREVQEVLAQREHSIGEFYATHENWVASIARLQTVVDSYPLYSHIDQVLISLGDAYEAQSRFIRTLQLPEDAKARLLRTYDDQAAAAYTRVATQYAASPHVEDARDRLDAMNRPIPEPTPEQLAASQALEDSRQTYTLANRAKGLIFRGPDTVQTARIGDPTLSDPKATVAPEVARRSEAAYKAALDPKATMPAVGKNAPAASEAPAADAPAAGTTAGAGSAPASLQDIPATDSVAPTSAGSSFTDTPTGVATPTSTGGSRSTGVTILSPGATDSTGNSSTPPPAGSVPAGTISGVGPRSNTELPAVEKAADAPETVNDVAGQKTPAGQAPVLDKNGKPKKVKPQIDKDEESSSTQKKKKGLKKLNPF